MGISACDKVPPKIAQIVICDHALAQEARVARRRDLASANIKMMEDIVPSSEMTQPTTSATQSRTSSQRAGTMEEDSLTSPTQHPRQGLSASFISSAIQKQRQKAAEIQIARCVIECNLAFNAVRTEACRRMVKAIAQFGPCDDWYGIDYKRLRTTMLDEERDRIEVQLEPIKTGWMMCGCSIISDGWSDTHRRHIINILVSSCLGTYFLRDVDACRAGVITGEFIFPYIKSAILEVGAENVVQVITDNASNYKRMGEMIEDEFPKIVWTPCAKHCVDLLLEDIRKLPWIEPIVNDAKRIVNFIRKNHLALSVFHSHSTMEMIRPADTRFGYIYLVLRRLQKVIDALRVTIIDRCSTNVPHSQTELTRYVQRKVLDESFWKEINSLVPALIPIYILLCIVDKEGSTLGLVYHFYMQMRQAIDASSSACERNWSAYSLIHTKLRNRLTLQQLERLVFCKANLRLVHDLKTKTDRPKQPLPEADDIDIAPHSIDYTQIVEPEYDEDGNVTVIGDIPSESSSLSSSEGMDDAEHDD
ncbi:hypothetical protein KP509_25G000500 [Ceratopteris richardii]|uniref:DUF659 domain-containing protein n=1 Tax=Ceratopteris richardii TaxID=49495 RepID=A0A8T2RM82_CERRI|nr:hypothetical protein KP509_25G000500 [Ceratopteris richardii]